jgi:hypothetical protein
MQPIVENAVPPTRTGASGLRALLGIARLTFGEWREVAGIALGLLAVVELGKWINHKIHAND